MFVDCLQHFLVNLHGIAATQVGHPLFLELLLVVHHHLSAHVLIVLGGLQFLAIDCINGELVKRLHRGVLLEDFAVYKLSPFLKMPFSTRMRSTESLLNVVRSFSAHWSKGKPFTAFFTAFTSSFTFTW